MLNYFALWAVARLACYDRRHVLPHAARRYERFRGGMHDSALRMVSLRDGIPLPYDNNSLCQNMSAIAKISATITVMYIFPVFKHE